MVYYLYRPYEGFMDTNCEIKSNGAIIVDIVGCSTSWLVTRDYRRVARDITRQNTSHGQH